MHGSVWWGIAMQGSARQGKDKLYKQREYLNMMELNKKSKYKKVITWSLLGAAQAFVLMRLAMLLKLSSIITWLIFAVALVIIIFVEVKYLRIGKLDEEVIEEIKDKL